MEPELPDHPKYDRLKRRVGDYAMEALVRLWGHCQQNGRGELWRGADAEYVEIVAGWDEGQPGLLFKSLLDTGWIHQTEEGIVIHDWEEMNKQIVGNWKNGPKGGRPKKAASPQAQNPLVNPTETQRREASPVGLSAISGGTEKNPLVNPTSDSVTQSLTPREPYQRNVTEHNETERTGTVLADGHRAGETPALPGGVRYDLAESVIHFLNEQTGAEFKGTRSEIDAAANCLLSVGNDFEGVKKMVARQVALWSAQPKTAAWLQPRTLFDEEKFPGYFAMRNLPTDNVTTDPVARRRELDEAIQKHPANRQSVCHNPHCTPEQKEHLRALRQELAEVTNFNPKKMPASSNA